MCRIYSVDEVEAMHGRGLMFIGEDLKHYTYLSEGPYGTFYFLCEGHRLVVDAGLRTPGNQLLPVIGFSDLPPAAYWRTVRIVQVRDELRIDPLWRLFVKGVQVGDLHTNRELVVELLNLGIRGAIRTVLIRAMEKIREGGK